MRDDLINQIAKLSNIDHVVVLSHNIDFVFLQTVFLSALKKCGHPSLTVFADAHCARESYQVQGSLVTGLGRRYRVVPVNMTHGYRFHPKAVFLVGEESAVLFVGSGNMTFGGMRENVEIWNRFDIFNDGNQQIAAFRDYLYRIVDWVPFVEAKKTDLAEFFDERNNKWVAALGDAAGLIGRMGDADSLIDQIRGGIGVDPVLKITILAPYFDPKADALKTLSTGFLNPEVDVLIQPKQSTLFREAAQGLPENIALKTVGFADRKADGDTEHRFIHAKYFAFQGPNKVDVFAGSANCSVAALLKNGPEGNAELMVHQTMTKEAFKEEFLSEFAILDADPELVSADDVETEEGGEPQIHVLGARFDVNVVRVAYELSKDVDLRACSLDDMEMDFDLEREGELVVRTVVPPRVIWLTGFFDGREVHSNRIWVDDESSLRSTSKGRALLEKIRHADSRSPMQAEDWTLIVELFAKDLEYTTARQFASDSKDNDSEGDESLLISRSDVFSDAYDHVPDYSGHLSEPLGPESANIYTLLLNAFGIGKSVEHAVDEEEDEEDIVDKPETIGKKSIRRPKPEGVTDRSRKRINKVINAITESLTDEFYLEHRDPERLGTDLQIAGLVLRKALSEQWMEDRQFFDVTQKIWSTLFFSRSKSDSKGWLGIRHRRAKDPDKFVRAISSPRLAATLYAWVLAIDLEGGGDVYLQRFLLSLLLGMGRYPWLWHDGLDEEEIYAHLRKILAESPCGADEEFDVEVLYPRRIALLRQGVALAEMERALNASDTTELRTRLGSTSAEQGEILWQGKRSVCITLESTSNSGPYTRVLCLQDPEGDTAFGKGFLMPVRELLKPDVLAITDEFGEAEREAVFRAMQELSSIEALGGEH